MAELLSKPSPSGGTTSHADEIQELRDAAKVQADHGLVATSVIYNAAADLLETHDSTGISLENFGAVGDLVNFALRDLGMAPYLPNGV